MTGGPRRARCVIPHSGGGQPEQRLRSQEPGPASLMTLSSLLVHDLQSFGLDNVRTGWNPWREGSVETGPFMSDVGSTGNRFPLFWWCSALRAEAQLNRCTLKRRNLRAKPGANMTFLGSHQDKCRWPRLTKFAGPEHRGPRGHTEESALPFQSRGHLSAHLNEYGIVRLVFLSIPQES